VRTITLAASKGGVGKTTLAACFAVEASRRSKVAVLDLDPQLSLTRWHELRGEPANPQMLTEGASVEAAERRAMKAGFDWLIIDTPPALMTRIAPAIDIADLVVIPVRPSPLDLEAIDPVIELCRQSKRPFVFVISQNPPRSSLTKGAVGYLEAHGDVLEEMVSLRTAHAGAAISGKTAPEIEKDDKSAEEISTLWKAIVKRASADAKAGALAKVARS
jgi:chromosome partitioning protein